MFLKAEELSADEKSRLQDHLDQCEDCRNEYEQIMLLLEIGRFKSPSSNTRFLEARIIKNLEEYQDRKSNRKGNPFRKPLLRAMAVASVIFFIIFSVEQANTIRKITRLENKLAGTGGKAINQKGQILVLNHFYDMDDLKQILNPDFIDPAHIDPIFLKRGTGNLYFNLFERRGNKLLKEVLESHPFDNVIRKGKYYGNSRLLNPSFNKNQKP